MAMTEEQAIDLAARINVYYPDRDIEVLIPGLVPEPDKHSVCMTWEGTQVCFDTIAQATDYMEEEETQRIRRQSGITPKEADKIQEALDADRWLHGDEPGYKPPNPFVLPKATEPVGGRPMRVESEVMSAERIGDRVRVHLRPFDRTRGLQDPLCYDIMNWPDDTRVLGLVGIELVRIGDKIFISATHWADVREGDGECSQVDLV